MSVDYYSPLEQRRGPLPSVAMVSALARTLRLGLDARDHLFRLAGHPAPARTGGSWKWFTEPDFRALYPLEDQDARPASGSRTCAPRGRPPRRRRRCGACRRVVILSAAPASESYGKLKLLGVLGDQEVGT